MALQKLLSHSATASLGLEHTAREQAPSSMRRLFKALLQIHLAVKTPLAEFSSALSAASSQPRQGSTKWQLPHSQQDHPDLCYSGPGERRSSLSVMPKGAQLLQKGAQAETAPSGRLQSVANDWVPGTVINLIPSEVHPSPRFVGGRKERPRSEPLGPILPGLMPKRADV